MSQSIRANLQAQREYHDRTDAMFKERGPMPCAQCRWMHGAGWTADCTHPNAVAGAQAGRTIYHSPITMREEPYGATRPERHCGPAALLWAAGE